MCSCRIEITSVVESVITVVIAIASKQAKAHLSAQKSPILTKSLFIANTVFMPLITITQEELKTPALYPYMATALGTTLERLTLLIPSISERDPVFFEVSGTLTIEYTNAPDHEPIEWRPPITEITIDL